MYTCTTCTSGSVRCIYCVMCLYLGSGVNVEMHTADNVDIYFKHIPPSSSLSSLRPAVHIRYFSTDDSRLTHINHEESLCFPSSTRCAFVAGLLLSIYICVHTHTHPTKKYSCVVNRVRRPRTKTSSQSRCRIYMYIYIYTCTYTYTLVHIHIMYITR